MPRRVKNIATSLRRRVRDITVVVWIYVTRRDLSMVKRQILRFAVCLLEIVTSAGIYGNVVNGSDVFSFVLFYKLKSK